MFVTMMMITFSDVPGYSQDWPLAPAGSCVEPAPTTLTGVRTLVPRAALTRAAVGQVRGAGEVFNDGIGLGLGETTLAVVVVELPQAAMTITARVAATIRASTRQE